MNVISKQFEGLATSFRANSFRGAVIRLTAYYTADVFLVLLVSSFLVYGLFAVGIEHEFHEDRVIVIEEIQDLNTRGTSERILENLFSILLFSDGVLLIFTVIVSYFLARSTLAPLARSYERQKQFVADAAHELRTPLAVLKAGSEVLLNGTRSTGEYKKFITDALEEIQRLIVLANDLLFLAQEKKIIKRVHKIFSLSDLCIQQCEQVKPYAETHGIHLESVIGTGVPLLGDRDDIARMVLNVLKNAIDYNKPSGSVTLHLYTESSHIHLDIVDTGVGIASEDTPHIFDRFYKADVSRAQIQNSGSGLGLSIVQEIVHAHGGTVVVTSEVGVGSTFAIIFPLRN